MVVGNSVTDLGVGVGGGGGLGVNPSPLSQPFQ